MTPFRGYATLGKKADLLVVADRRNLDPRGLAQFSDRQHQIPLEAIVARDITLDATQV
jgi:hypothetical protein